MKNMRREQVERVGRVLHQYTRNVGPSLKAQIAAFVDYALEQDAFDRAQPSAAQGPSVDPPCGCEPGGWVIMNADPERGELGQVQRCDSCRELASEESAWALAKAAGYTLDEDGNVLAAPAPKRVHELKAWPAEFQAVFAGKKRHETRRNDRDFQPGDTVVLKEWANTARYRCQGCGDWLTRGDWEIGHHTRTIYTERGDAEPEKCGPLRRLQGYTGRELTFTIGHVTAGPSWGLPEDLVVFTLLDAPPPLVGLQGSAETGPSFRADREVTADRVAESEELGRVEGVDRG